MGGIKKFAKHAAVDDSDHSLQLSRPRLHLSLT
jgi:hypothetical protein